MCRFAVRNGQAAAAPLDAPKLEAAPINLDALFAQGNEELDASDMALLALFSGQAPAGGAEDGQQPASAGSSAGSPLGASCNTVVVGQAMTAPATQQAGAGLLPTAAPANPVQQLQFQAVLQHQAAIMQNPGTYPAAAQMYQQAMLQTGVLPSQPSGTLTYSGSLATATAPAGGPAPVLAGKRGKTQEEIEEQTERIKKRRRESAQRSRQRKNAYMKSLEMENRALKLENERLRMELCKSTGAPLPPPPAAAPKASSASVSRSAEASLGADGSEHASGHDEDGGLCHPLMPAGMGAVALDPLAMMPTADLLSFAF